MASDTARMEAAKDLNILKPKLSPNFLVNIVRPAKYFIPDGYAEFFRDLLIDSQFCIPGVNTHRRIGCFVGYESPAHFTGLPSKVIGNDIQGSHGAHCNIFIRKGEDRDFILK